MQGYIYLIENKINGKKYIGQTARSIKERIEEHKKDANLNNSRPICKAIRKYGWRNFTVRILEICSIENISEREIYWIDFYGAYGNKGYNATRGGEGKILFNDKEIIESFQETCNMAETARNIGCSADCVALALRRNNIPPTPPNERIYKISGKPVSAYDLQTGELIKSFPSQSHAGEWIIQQGKTKMSNAIPKRLSYFIGRAARGLDNRKQAYGYIWRFD